MFKLNENLFEDYNDGYITKDLVDKTNDPVLFDAYDRNQLSIVAKDHGWWFEGPIKSSKVARIAKQAMKKFYPDLTYLYDIKSNSKINEDIVEYNDANLELPDAIFSDFEENTDSEELSGPEPGPDTGLSDLILTAINDENDTIKNYNMLIANLGSHEDFIPVINDILEEENLHVGQLQTLLKQISPNAEKIAQGEVEADTQLSESLFTEDLDLLDEYGLSGRSQKFYYQFLDRLRSDCEYYLGAGNLNKNNLWTKDEEDQINLMRKVLSVLNEKPEWLTEEDIDDYEFEMLG